MEKIKNFLIVKYYAVKIIIQLFIGYFKWAPKWLREHPDASDEVFDNYTDIWFRNKIEELRRSYY